MMGVGKGSSAEGLCDGLLKLWNFESLLVDGVWTWGWMLLESIVDKQGADFASAQMRHIPRGG
jgi:hypothetical protein